MPAKKDGKSSADYYRENKASADKKRAYQREYNKSPKERAKRSELIQKNREADKKNIDRSGKDFDHSVNRYVDSSKNRGRTGRNGPGTSGDKRARGGKNK